jgi:multisubunit Na+/H+ antiporter MnhC subunit
MFRVKKFLSLTAIVIGGLIGASMLTYFSFAQNYDELIKENLIKRVLHFMMPEHNVYLYAVTEANTYRIVFDEN